MKKYLEKLYQHQSLTQEEAFDALQQISVNKVNASQIASFITVFLMRGLSTQEFKGFSDALLNLCIPIKFDKEVMDVCGTGGDGKSTFNISTLTALVVASYGIPVAKHGNYGVSSISGSSNVLEYLGYQFTNDTDGLKKQLDQHNICFLHAPLFHPALKQAAPIRKELGIKTFFNMLGPLINPASPQNRMIGVYNQEIGRCYHYLLQQSAGNYTIVHSIDGYDEISTTADFKLFHQNGEEQVSMQDLNIPIVNHKDLSGGNTIAEAAKIFVGILQGKGTVAQTNAIAVNTGIAIETITKKDRLHCIEIAKEIILSGKAYHTFNQLIKNN